MEHLKQAAAWWSSLHSEHKAVMACRRKCICCVQVAKYVSILEKDLGDRKRTAEVDIGALLRSSYSEYFAVETQKRLKSVPVAFFPMPPTQLFPNAAKLEFPGWVC